MSTFIPTYAATNAQTGRGDVVAISVDGGTTYTQIMQTKNIQYSGQKKDTIDVSSTTSVGGYKEFIGGLKDGGSLTFDMVFDPADPGQIALAAAYDADTKLTVRHVFKAQAGFTSGPINTFTAIVESCPQPGSDESKVTTMAVSLKISGPITTTPAVTS